MSKKYRESRKVRDELASNAVVDNPNTGYFAFDTSPQEVLEHFSSGHGAGYAQNPDGTFNGDYVAFAGPVFEGVHGEFPNGYAPPPVPVGSIKDRIDYEVGGSRGLVDQLPYSIGVVDASLVEDFNYQGQQVLLRRDSEMKQARGAVSTADYSATLPIIFAQMTARYYPNEVSQADLTRSV